MYVCLCVNNFGERRRIIVLKKELDELPISTRYVCMYFFISTLTGPERHQMMHFIFKRETLAIAIEYLYIEDPNLGTHSHLY